MSLLPAPWKGHFAIRGPLHNLEHVLAFCALFLMVSDHQRDWRSHSSAAVAVFAFGLLLEALQARVYKIHIEYPDLLDDAFGVALGLLARFSYRIRSST